MVGHEYGHHIAQGFKLYEDSMSEEHQADIFARLASYDVAHRVRNTPYNFFLISGSGAPLLLGSLEILLKARRVLAAGNDTLPVSDTHPPIRERIAVFDVIDKASLELEEQALRFSNFRYSLLFILDTIWGALKPHFEKLHREGVRPTPDPSDVLGRLLSVKSM